MRRGSLWSPASIYFAVLLMGGSGLFVAEGLHGLDAGGAPGGEPSGG